MCPIHMSHPCVPSMCPICLSRCDCRYDFPSPWWDPISKEAKDLVKGLLTVDPKKRLTAEQVIQSSWVSGNTASATPLPGISQNLKKYNATRKLKKAAQGIMAAKRVAKMTAALQAAK